MPDPVVASPAAAAPAAAAEPTTLATSEPVVAGAEADAAAVAAAAKTEAERVAALTPEQRTAEETATAKAKQEASDKANADAAEKVRRDALTPEARKAEDDAKAKADAESEAAKHAPEKYEFVVPEGVKVDPAINTEFEAIAREHDIPQAAAQKLYDIGLKAAGQGQQALVDGVAAMQASWLETSKADKEFGGADLEKNMAIAKTTIVKFGDAELKTILNQTKLGDHPALVRWMYRVGKAMSEDGFVTGDKGVNRDNSDEGRAKRLYPSMNP